MASLETQDLQTFRLNKVASHYATSILTGKVNVAQKRNRLLEMPDSRWDTVGARIFGMVDQSFKTTVNQGCIAANGLVEVDNQS